MSSDTPGTNGPSRGQQGKGRFGVMLITGALAIALGVAWMVTPGRAHAEGGILIIASGLVVVGFALLFRRRYR